MMNENYCTSMLCIKGGNPMYFNVNGIINRQYYLVFSVSALVFGWGAQYLPEAEGRGQIRHRGQIQGGYWKHQVMLYLLHTWTVFVRFFLYNKISPRQTRHTNPGGLHVMTWVVWDHYDHRIADTFCWQRIA